VTRKEKKALDWAAGGEKSTGLGFSLVDLIGLGFSLVDLGRGPPLSSDQIQFFVGLFFVGYS